MRVGRGNCDLYVKFKNCLKIKEKEKSPIVQIYRQKVDQICSYFKKTKTKTKKVRATQEERF